MDSHTRTAPDSPLVSVVPLSRLERMTMSVVEERTDLAAYKRAPRVYFAMDVASREVEMIRSWPILRGFHVHPRGDVGYRFGRRPAKGWRRHVRRRKAARHA